MALGSRGGATLQFTREELLKLARECPTINLSTTARALDLAPSTLYRQAASGELGQLVRLVKLGGQYRVVTASLLDFLGLGDA